MNERPIPLWPGKAPYTAACGNQPQPSVMPFPVKNARCAFVVCPGGGYEMKAEHEGAPIAQMLNVCGVSAYVLDYRVSPCPHQVPLTDALRAVRVVRSLGYEKVGILGFSAGGHLSCCAATLYEDGDPDADDPAERISSRPDAFVPCYAVVSFKSIIAHLGSKDSLLGLKKTDTELIKRYSAELNVTPHTPPAFIWHTADDDVVPALNSLMLAAALSENGVPFELHVFPSGAHGLGLAEDNETVSQWPALLKRWLAGQNFI